MPSMSNEVERRVRRFSEQRWVLDNVIRANGVCWDQGDIDYALFPCGIIALGDFLRVERAVKKYNDIAREYSAAATLRQTKGDDMAARGYDVAARDSYYIASILYGQAQWPIAENTAQNRLLEERKNYCYGEYAKRADHVTRQAEVPYKGKALPGWLHLPPTYKEGDKVPLVITVGGMDSTKEICVALSSDQFLSRGVAVFLFDGPGQYSSAMRGIHIDQNGFYDAGPAVYEWISAQPEIDLDRIAVRGVSMGSIWGTQLATTIPNVKACSVAYPSYEKGENTAFNMYSPSFKLRFMFMSGYTNEAEFDTFIQGINSEGLGEKVTFPYLVIGGEDDDFASIESTFEVLNAVTAPKELMIYKAEGHTLHSRPSSYVGPNEFAYIADWTCDRFKGVPMDSVYTVIDSRGAPHHEAWGENRKYDYGLPAIP